VPTTALTTARSSLPRASRVSAITCPRLAAASSVAESQRLASNAVGVALRVPAQALADPRPRPRPPLRASSAGGWRLRPCKRCPRRSTSCPSGSPCSATSSWRSPMPLPSSRPSGSRHEHGIRRRPRWSDLQMSGAVVPPGVSADNFAERTVELHLDWMTLRRPDGHWAVMAAPGAGRESYLAAAFACALARASVRSASPT